MRMHPMQHREAHEVPMVITQLPARPQRSSSRPTSAASALTQASTCHAISSSLSLDSTLAARVRSTDSGGERSQELRQQLRRRRAKMKSEGCTALSTGIKAAAVTREGQQEDMRSCNKGPQQQQQHKHQQLDCHSTGAEFKNVRHAPDKSSHQPMKPTTRDSSRNGAGRPEHCSSVEHCDDAERCDAVRRRRRWRTRPAAPCGTCGEEPSALWCATCRVAYCLRCFGAIAHHAEVLKRMGTVPFSPPILPSPGTPTAEPDSPAQTLQTTSKSPVHEASRGVCFDPEENVVLCDAKQAGLRAQVRRGLALTNFKSQQRSDKGPWEPTTATAQIGDACDQGLQPQHSPAPQTSRRSGCTSALIGSGDIDPHYHKRRPRVLPPEPQLRSAADGVATLSAADSVAALRRQRAKTSAARPPSRSLWRALQAAPVATLSLSGAAAAQPSAAARGVVNMRGRAVHVAPVQ
eukprot:TRINITY_DN19919_c0_g1_i1.p1 TRINITY_DN19919_c0_g1~~TRINITY_DN19919_c0_g1_i1.p1  ORF type:complete len:463 (+),score=81.42 TRINITY_DN19919_c0_g1_i1:443-1831(+)